MSHPFIYGCLFYNCRTLHYSSTRIDNRDHLMVSVSFTVSLPLCVRTSICRSESCPPLAESPSKLAKQENLVLSVILLSQFQVKKFQRQSQQLLCIHVILILYPIQFQEAVITASLPATNILIPGTTFSVSILTGSAVSILSLVLIVDTDNNSFPCLASIQLPRNMPSSCSNTSLVTASFEVSSSGFYSFFQNSICFLKKI